MYYVYELIDVRTDTPFYVGKGKKENERHNDHFNENLNNNTNRHKYYKIQFLKKHGYDIPVNILVDNIKNEDDAYALEEHYIRKYGRKNIDNDGILTNICPNNRPPNKTGIKQTSEHIRNRVNSYKQTCATTGKKGHTAETKAKISEKLMGKNNPFYGKTHTNEIRAKISQRMKGNANRGKTFIITSPDNVEYIVENRLYSFCKEHGLPSSTMEKILYKNQHPTSGKCVGWKIRRKE